MRPRGFLFIVCLVMCSIGLSGCALLGLPFQMVGGLFDLVGKVVGIASKVPLPPPGVFY